MYFLCELAFYLSINQRITITLFQFSNLITHSNHSRFRCNIIKLYLIFYLHKVVDNFNIQVSIRLANAF